MHVWQSSKEIIGLFEQQQNRLKSHLGQLEYQLTLVTAQQAKTQQQWEQITAALNFIISPGLLSQKVFYGKLREQGVLLSHQQLLSSKLNELEEEKIKLKAEIGQQRQLLLRLTKKIYKVNYHSEAYRRECCRREDSIREGDIMESVIYSGKY